MDMSHESIAQRLTAELELRPEMRRFGSGWLSGVLGLVSGVSALLMAVALRYHGLLTDPDLSVIRDGAAFKWAMFGLLFLGYGLASLSLILRRSKLLGTFAMTATMAALVAANLPPSRMSEAVNGHGVFFGLDFFVVNVLFAGLLFAPIERLAPRRPDQRLFRSEWREDLFYYLVSSLMVQVLTWLAFSPWRFILAHASLADTRAFFGGLPFGVQIVLIMFFTDAAQYWIHWTFHRVPSLWEFHAVHHSAKSLDWIAGARMHFVEIAVLRGVTATPMFVLGFTPAAIQTYVLIVYVYSSFIHANLGTDFGALEAFFVSPRFHHWHHAIDQEAIDVNFSLHFTLFDRLFGTYHMPDQRWPTGYGIGGHPVPRGYWAQFLYPFRRGRA